MESASATTSSDLLDSRFAQLKREKRKALVCYVTAGHPDPGKSVELLRGLQDAGADVIEVGVPFSDPLADGPVIQGSSQIALSHGINFAGTLQLIREAAVDVPIVLFSYLNPVLAAGSGALDAAAKAGVHGVLITDMPVGADPDRERWFGNGPLAFVRLVAPTTPVARMQEIARNGRGFVYLISRLGVTGERSQLAAELPETIARLRQATDLPICVGFGISTPAQARTVGELADGVVVGSAIVSAAGRDGVPAALALVRAMRKAMDAP